MLALVQRCLTWNQKRCMSIMYFTMRLQNSCALYKDAPFVGYMCVSTRTSLVHNCTIQCTQRVLSKHHCESVCLYVLVPSHFVLVHHSDPCINFCSKHTVCSLLFLAQYLSLIYICKGRKV